MRHIVVVSNWDSQHQEMEPDQIEVSLEKALSQDQNLEGRVIRWNGFDLQVTGIKVSHGEKIITCQSLGASGPTFGSWSLREPVVTTILVVDWPTDRFILTKYLMTDSVRFRLEDLNTLRDKLFVVSGCILRIYEDTVGYSSENIIPRLLRCYFVDAAPEDWTNSSVWDFYI